VTATDESLFRASANGNQAAFSELYERHARTIYNKGRQRTGQYARITGAGRSAHVGGGTWMRARYQGFLTSP
jgi:hypothetical protein